MRRHSLMRRDSGAYTTVIPAKAGIYGCRPHCRSMGIRTPDSGFRRNDGCRGMGMTVVEMPG